MTHDIAINGDNAVALAWRQVDPDVCAAYPITPQTIIVEKFAEYVANGEVTTEFVCVESEHSALTLCTSAASAGARTFTATASQGLAYMWEMMPITAAMRVPIIMAVANRAVSGPININNDHGDAMSARDCGWLQLYSENVQQAYDNSIIAPRIAEHHEIQLPCLVNLDGFILSHAIERMTMVETMDVREFVGEYEPLYPLLDYKHPVSQEVFKEFADMTGREYHLVDEYMCDDAEFVAVILGSSFGTMKETVDQLRAEGIKAGCAMPHVYRPWPEAALAKVMKGKKAVAVFDKHLSIGAYGPMYPEVVAAAADLDSMPKMYNVIYGLGGADATVAGFKKMMEEINEGKAAKVTYLGVKA